MPKEGIWWNKREVRKGYHPTARSVENYPAYTGLLSSGTLRLNQRFTRRLLECPHDFKRTGQ